MHGGRQMYHHEEVGYNSRLDALQAAILSAKLPHLTRWSDACAVPTPPFYDQALAGLDEIVPTPPAVKGNESIFNQYTIRVLGRPPRRARGALKAGAESGAASTIRCRFISRSASPTSSIVEGDFPESERAAA